MTPRTRVPDGSVAETDRFDIAKRCRGWCTAEQTSLRKENLRRASIYAYGGSGRRYEGEGDSFGRRDRSDDYDRGQLRHPYYMAVMSE